MSREIASERRGAALLPHCFSFFNDDPPPPKNFYSLIHKFPSGYVKKTRFSVVIFLPLFVGTLVCVILERVVQENTW